MEKTWKVDPLIKNWNDGILEYWVNPQGIKYRLPIYFVEIFFHYSIIPIFHYSNTNVINKMTSPPLSPSPLEGEGRVGGKIIVMRLY